MIMKGNNFMQKLFLLGILSISLTAGNCLNAAAAAGQEPQLSSEFFLTVSKIQKSAGIKSNPNFQTPRAQALPESGSEVTPERPTAPSTPERPTTGNRISYVFTPMSAPRILSPSQLRYEEEAADFKASFYHTPEEYLEGRRASRSHSISPDQSEASYAKQLAQAQAQQLTRKLQHLQVCEQVDRTDLDLAYQASVAEILDQDQFIRTMTSKHNAWLRQMAGSGSFGHSPYSTL